MDKEDLLRQACAFDGKDPLQVIPCKADIFKLFIGKVTATIQSKAHDLLSTRQAQVLLDLDLTYAECRFEDLEYDHFMLLISLAEDIIIKKAAARVANLGEVGHDAPKRGLQLPGGNSKPTGQRTKWQQKSIDYEVRVNSTVANCGDIADLQQLIGGYSNDTTAYVEKTGVWCSPIRKYSEVMCTNCSKLHWGDTRCDKGDCTQKSSAGERHSICPPAMATVMESGDFKRLTFRFQGGSDGNPKARTQVEMTVAVTQVTVALTTAKPKRKSKPNQAQRAAKRAEVAATAAAAAAASGEEDEADDDQDEADESDALPTAERQVLTITKRPSRQSQVATRAQRRGHVEVFTITATTAQAEEGNAVQQGWANMRTTFLAHGRMRAVLRGSRVRGEVQQLLAAQRATEAANLDELMAAWRARMARDAATTLLKATVTMAITRREMRQQERKRAAQSSTMSWL